MPRSFQSQRFARPLQKRFGLQGAVPLTLLEDVMPVVAIHEEDDPAQAFLRGEHRWGRGASVVAVVGQYSAVSLALAPLATTLVVIESFLVFSDAGSVWWAVVDTDLPGAVGDDQNALDARSQPGRAAATLFAFNQVASPLNSADIAEAVTTPNIQVRIETPRVVLRPNSAFVTQSSAVNRLLSTYIRWREVPLAPQELTSG